MRSIAALIVCILPVTVFAFDEPIETIDLNVKEKNLLLVWEMVVEKCPGTRSEHRVIHPREPVSLKVEGVDCRDVLKMLVDFDLDVSPSK
ncbi:hypothetical protein [uncultured Microbulbifer sp.]|uniref:hypothetical protein n=1 Tax=uncultured Microbulbifer sp. TaxID=348147 RepID=UPI0025F54690|nr:hypothetical protein [uncultured Microbulbifer sp.]